MTFAATVVSRIGIWQVADHRLSRAGTPLTDPSMKQVLLECRDGKALISYAGIGASPQFQLHVSDWVRKLLRGRDLTVEGALNILVQAATDKLTRYHTHHTFMIGASVNSDPVFYGITNRSFDPNAKTFAIASQFQLMTNRLNHHPKCILFGMEGTGSLALQQFVVEEFPNGKFLIFDDAVNELYHLIEKRWHKPGIRFDVMGYLAHLNRLASKRLATSPKYAAYAQSVSEACFTIFLDPKRLTLEQRCHGHAEAIWVPTVAGRWDVTQLVKTVLPELEKHMIQCLEHHKQGLQMPEVDGDKLNELLRAQDWRTLDDFR